MHGSALLIGSGRFIGVHLAARLAGAGLDVHGTVRPGSDRSRLETLGDVAIHEVDVRDGGAVASLFERVSPAYAVNLACARGERTAAERRRTIETTVLGTAGVIDAAAASGCRRLVHVGSPTEYGPVSGRLREDRPLAPHTVFGAAKGAATLLCLAASAEGRLPCVVLRPFIVYGPGDRPHRLIPRAIAAATTGEGLPMTRPGLTRDWIYVHDVVEGCLSGLGGGADGEVVNLATGIEHTNEDVVDLVEQAVGRRVRRRIGAEPARVWDRRGWAGDTDKAERLLGWRAQTSLADGIRMTVQAELGAGSPESMRPVGA